MSGTPSFDDLVGFAAGDTTRDRRQRRRSQADAEASSAAAIMFVCAANVCRSPLMAYGFEEATRVDGVDTWSISSGGVTTKAPLPICTFAADVLQQHGVSDDVVTSHHSLRVEPGHLDRQDLIIAASKEERSAIALMRPALRSRTFTLNEAVTLGAAPVTAEELAAVSAASKDATAPLAVYAGVLHLRRGTVAVAPPTLKRRRWRAEVDPQDVPDVHHGRKRVHTTTLRALWDTTQRLHGQVSAALHADVSR